MGLMHRLAKRQDRLYDRLRDPRAHEVAYRTGTADGFDALRGHRYCLLVTFRRSGQPVPTPVWFGLDDGRLYVRSLADAGKVRRLRRDRRVRVCPCNARGKPLGTLAEGTGRVLEPSEAVRAEAALRSNHGWGRRVYEAIGTSLGVQTTYLEIVPTGVGTPSP